VVDEGAAVSNVKHQDTNKSGLRAGLKEPGGDAGRSRKPKNEGLRDIDSVSDRSGKSSDRSRRRKDKSPREEKKSHRQEEEKKE
jgi:hypothetical protein